MVDSFVEDLLSALEEETAKMSISAEDFEKLSTLSQQNLVEYTDKITAGFAKSINGLAKNQKDANQSSCNANRVKEACENVTRCDGLVIDELREWLADVDIAVEQTADIDKSVYKIIKKTT